MTFASFSGGISFLGLGSFFRPLLFVCFVAFFVFFEAVFFRFAGGGASCGSSTSWKLSDLHCLSAFSALDLVSERKGY